ncbi:MAG: plastocyanin/azurin family copper-binding protein [Thermoplasmatota archaeon]
MKWFWILLVTALLAGCTDDPDGSGSSSSSSTDSTDPVGNDTMEPDTGGAEVALSIAAVRALPTDTHAFDKATLAVNQGDVVTLTFSNDDVLPIVNHDWYLEVLDVGTAVIGSGETDTITFTVDLEPGEYVFYCTVGNHRGDGMEGMLVVT